MNPYSDIALWAAKQVAWNYMVPVGLAMVAGTLVFGFLRPSVKKQRRRQR